MSRKFSKRKLESLETFVLEQLGCVNYMNDLNIFGWVLIIYRDSLLINTVKMLYLFVSCILEKSWKIEFT